MRTRMEKYSDNHEFIGSRVNKNEKLYKDINSMDIDEYNPNNNVKVIGDNDDNIIDVDKIRNLLEKNYRELPKRKHIEIKEYDEEEIDVEPTKEYDINSILEKAKEEKIVDYNKDRLKRVHDTQYDILNGLELEKKDDIKPPSKEQEDELMTLINTITSKELSAKELEKKDSTDPLDLFADLKGSDNTQVLSGIEEEVKKQETQELIKEEKEELKNSFYTTTNAFTQSDFDDFNDLKNDLKGTRIVLRILIVLIIIAFIVGIALLINNYFNIF